MARFFALILAVVGGYFVYLAIQQGALPPTQLNLQAYYVVVAFIAFVNTILFASADFVEE